MKAAFVFAIGLVLALGSGNSAKADEHGWASAVAQGGVRSRVVQSAPVGPGRSPAAIIGADEREHVFDTSVYPWSSIAYLEAYKGLDTYQCTGTFVGPDVLLTAGHCVWDDEHGFADDISVAPGKDGSAIFGSEPYGHEFADSWAVPQDFINSAGADSEWDFGLIAMANADLGTTVGWLTVANLQATTLERPDFQPAIIGYPGDIGDGTEMWGATKARFLDVEDFLLSYDIDTAGGQSGSSILSLNLAESFGGFVVGIHTTGTPDYNFGSRVDAEFLDVILDMCDGLGCTIDSYTEPFVQSNFWADADCDGELTTRDNQAILRVVLSQPPLLQMQPCTSVGFLVAVNGFGNKIWADADCDGGLTTRDNQAVLRDVLAQGALSQTPPCPDIGDEVTLG